MPKRITDSPEAVEHWTETFAERYPDYPSWLDGNTWELDLAEDIHEPLVNFRANLRYQALVLGLTLVTKTIKYHNEAGEPVKVLRLRAY